LAETGTITRFDAANELALEMRQETSTDWEHYKRKYQPIYNKVHSSMLVRSRPRVER
jgi:hypothetical protein